MSSLRLKSVNGFVVNNLARCLLCSVSLERKFKSLSIERVNSSSLGVGYVIINLINRDKSTTYIVLLNSNLSYDDIDSESAHAFLEALSRGIVIDLLGSIVIELSDRLLYANIVSGGSDQLNTKFMHVSSTGIAHVWSYGREAQSLHAPTWSYITKLQLCSNNTVQMTHFYYMQEKEQVVFVERSNFNSNDSSIDCSDSVVLCSLAFSEEEEDNHIQLSKTVTIGQFPCIQQLHCQTTTTGTTSATAVIWVVCMNHEVYCYDYTKCRTLGFSLQSFTKYRTENENPPLLSAVYNNEEQEHHGGSAVLMLYILYKDIVYMIKTDGSQLYLHCAFNCRKVLQTAHDNNKLQHNAICVQDFYIASAVNNMEVIVLLTENRLNVVRLCSEPVHSVLIGGVLFPFPVRQCITISLPVSLSQRRPGREQQLQREEAGRQRRWVFLPEIALSASPTPAPGPILALTCGRGIYGLFARIRPGPSGSWLKKEIDCENNQIWQALFPSQTPTTTQLSDSFVLHTTVSTTTTTGTAVDMASAPLYTYESIKDFRTSLREYLIPSSMREETIISPVWREILEENRSSEGIEQAVLAWCTRQYEGSESASSGSVFPLTLACLNRLSDSIVQSSSEHINSDKSMQQGGGSGIGSNRAAGGEPDQAVDADDRNEETGWLAQLHPTSLTPLSAACTSEEVARLVDPLLLLTIVTALQTHSFTCSSAKDGDNSSSKAHTATTSRAPEETCLLGKLYVFLVLRVIFWLRPSSLVGFVQYLQQKQRVSKSVEETSHHSPAIAPKYSRNRDVPSTICTLLGAPPVSSLGSLPVAYPEPFEAGMAGSHEEDDEIFGLSSHLREVRPSLPPRPHFIPHVYGQRGQQNISSSVCIDKDGMVLKEEQYGVRGGLKSIHSSASEDSGDDVYGIFRDVGEDDEEEATEESAIVTAEDPGLWKQRLLSAVLPLLSKDAAAVSESTVSLSSSIVMRTCLGLVQSVQSAPTPLTLSGGVLSNRRMSAQRARSMCQVLLLAGRPVQAVESLVCSRQYAALVALCLQICASAPASTEKVMSNTSAVASVQRSGRQASSYKTQQEHPPCNRAEKGDWEALLSYVASTTEALVADSLHQVVRELISDSSSSSTTDTSQAGGETERAITLPQLQLVEAIVSLKLSLKCLLSAHEDIASRRIGWITQLIRCRPREVELSVLRSWVTVHASTAELRRQILCSQEFLP